MQRRTTILFAFLLLGATWANAASKNEPPLIIEVLATKTETTPLNTGNNDVPKDCNIMDFSAYCHHSRTAIVRHIMMVRDESGKSFTIACTVDSIWSKCVALPVGAKLSAQWAKRGIRVWYPGARGNEVKQTYALVAEGGNEAEAWHPGAASVEPASSAPKSAETAIAAGSATGPEVTRDTVKCNFTSTPSGAEITLDGMYVGNTPSMIAIGPGRHVVGLALPGFASWKRELTLLSGSDVTVSATLQKAHH